MRLADLDRHLFEVECRVEAPAGEQRLSLPSWIPGSYLLREFARHVVAVSAQSGGAAVPVEKVDHSTWLCRGAQGELTVRALVYALDQSVRGAFLDRRRGYFNGTHLFLLPAGREAEPVELAIERPAHAACDEWRVATAMTPRAVDERGFGTYRAADYDELIDHPVEISDFESVEFEAGGVPHLLVVAGRFDSDLERVATDLAQLCETQIDFFGRPPPFDRYVFLGLAVGEGYGGLEHRASTSLIFSRDDLPKPGEPSVTGDYQRFLALASHEYFHTWHVKRTKPAAFVPYDLSRRNHTRLLWVFEGFTSYYQEIMLLRSGLVGAAAFLQRLGELATRVYRVPGRLKQSLEAASFDAWDVHYKPEPHSVNTSVSYYGKGALAALALDLELRRDTGGKVSLDTVMLELWRRYGAKGVGVPEDGFEALVGEVSGLDLAAFFDGVVRGTQDPPLEELLRDFGITLGFRPQTGPDDKGGTRRADADGEVLALGCITRERDAGLELVAVLDGGPAERAGLEPGDVLIALDRLKVNERNLRRRLARFEAGERVTASVFRGDELIEVGLVLRPAPLDTVYLEPDDGDPAAVERRKAWLGV
ncbi:MAG TPA: PDZ domain-containing protein [Gammaproteobacteria bacterium]